MVTIDRAIELEPNDPYNHVIRALILVDQRQVKQAIVAAAETDTVFLNRHSRPGLRALRTEFSEPLEQQEHVGLDVLGRVLDLYFGGDMNASIALSGQVAGRIDEVKPVARIIEEIVSGFMATVSSLAAAYPATDPSESA